MSKSTTSRTQSAARHRRAIRAVAALTTTLLCAAAVTAATATGAAADTPAQTTVAAVQHVYATGGEGLYFHPDAPTLDSSYYGYAMPDGTEFDVICWANGDNVLGDSVWEYGTDADTGDSGYAADYYIDTDVTQGDEGAQLAAQGVPQCSSDPSADQDSGQSSAGAPANPLDSYQRQLAVGYALAHAQDPQIEGAECTWFVSNALWAGGLAKTADWTDAGEYRGAPGTQTAWQVEPMIEHLEATYDTTWEDITGDLTTNAVPDAEPGDIIVYDWENDGTYDHMSLVTDIADGDYPDVAEMGQFDWTTHPWYRYDHPVSSYVTRGWTWSEQNNKWLQSEDGHAGMRAYLLHFNGGIDAPSY